MLPVPDGIWHCQWCRRTIGPEAVEAAEKARWEEHTRKFGLAPTSPRPPLAALQCELLDDAFWSAGARASDAGDLPQPSLPDGRWVVCIPATRSFGSILAHEWRRILATARKARGPIIKHAYERTLENLQRWKEVGRDLASRYLARDALSAKGELNAENDPFPNYNDHAPLMAWIQDWADDLRRPDFPDYQPFERARRVLADATGFAPRTIESIVQRHRGKAVSATKRSSTKKTIRRRSPTAKRRG